MTSWDHWAVVAGAGAIGATCRYGVGLLCHGWQWAAPYPFLSTVIVNLAGSFAFGCLAQMVTEAELVSPLLRLALLTGFLGAFTTFSAYSYDTLELFQQRGLAWAGGYVLVQNTLGIALALLGVGLVRYVNSPA